MKDKKNFLDLLMRLPQDAKDVVDKLNKRNRRMEQDIDKLLNPKRKKLKIKK